MGKALRGSPADGGAGRRALSTAARTGAGLRRLAGRAALALLSLCAAPATIVTQEPGGEDDAAERFDAGRFTVLAYPRDRQLARSMLAQAVRLDTFPGLARPRSAVVIAIAPDRQRFREWIGPAVPEWGAAVAFPESQRIVMQGSRAGSDAGDPLPVLRHELAHLALYEALGPLPPRWFDEGYASVVAGEWSREEVLATSLALAIRGVPSLAELEEEFHGGSMRAQQAYALAHRAVAELAALDRERGLSIFFREWRRTSSMDRAVRNAYGITLGSFEERWQRRTRRRYGYLALVTDFTLASLVALLLVAPFYSARRRRDRERMAALRASDRAFEQDAVAWEGAGLGPEIPAEDPPPSVSGEGDPDGPDEGYGR